MNAPEGYALVISQNIGTGKKGEKRSIRKIINRILNREKSIANRVQELSKDAHKDPGELLPFTTTWDEKRDMSYVLRLLPHFHGAQPIDVLRSVSADGTIWDLGCGENAVSLKALANESALLGSKKPRLVGVTLDLGRQGVTDPEGVTIVRQDVNDFLRSFQRSDTPNRPQVIYSSQMWRWLPRPYVSLKLAYNALAPNGILLIDQFDNGSHPLLNAAGSKANPEEFARMLQKMGYDVEIQNAPGGDDVTDSFSLAIKKNPRKPHLHLPLRMVTPEEVRMDNSYLWNHFYSSYLIPEDERYFYQMQPHGIGERLKAAFHNLQRKR